MLIVGTWLVVIIVDRVEFGRVRFRERFVGSRWGRLLGDRGFGGEVVGGRGVLGRLVGGID